MLLPDDDNDDSLCYRVDIKNWDQTVCARVYALQAAGSWTKAGYILELDLASERFFIIDLPERVEFEYDGNLAPCRGDNSFLYLFHVKGGKLTVWLQRMNDHGGAGSNAGEWVPRDTISLLETRGHLLEQGPEPEDGEEAAVSVVGVGDNAEFVFLELEETGAIVYMHLKSRKVKKVYQRHPYDDIVIRVHPVIRVPDEGT
ncbi:hypothetical protein BAE44_0009174 [Dichanthelium oligosanthes]|uniref:F-box protein AT5G49610-like beta-propeller domain-containing protein n=1 Tax=Dichanthelium oligosanthes TaxID=888268 RepID=A0A1E5VXF8_9POAL|nr:hypothetical protein BAE44_0009174 [Dichanthelium oligosanthes]